MQYSFVVIFIGALSVAPAVLAQAEKGALDSIKKCQDASGTWHYGDFAAEECARSKITEIDKRGLTVKEIAAPPTAEEIRKKAADKAQRAEEQQRMAAQRKEEQLLLNTYENAEAIVRARNDRVAAIDREIATNNKIKEKYVAEAKALGSDPKLAQRLARVRDQISEFDNANATRLQERADVVKHYDELYIRYQTLVNKSERTSGR